MRWLWFCAGWLMVLLGFIGALLPVMPTTVFLIAATACFARSSPRFERWLLEHPRFGPVLQAWRREGAISRRTRRIAFSGMAAGYLLFWFIVSPSWLVAVPVTAFFLSGAWYVGSRPLPQRDATGASQPEPGAKDPP